MRVAHVITGLGVGGAERMLTRMVAVFGQRFDSHVVSLTTEGRLATDLRGHGATVHAVQMARGFGTHIGGFARLTRLVKRLNPAVVQTWMYHADLIGGSAARLAGVKAVAWNIRNGELESARGTTRSVIRLSAGLSRLIPKVIVCSSESARQAHERVGYAADRLHVIPNGFDTARFKPDSSARASVCEELDIPQDAPLIGLIARLDPLKNHALFFEAARRLHALRPSVHFLLAGTGVDSQNPLIRRWLTEAGVARVTRVVGERDDIPRLTAALDVATCCSLSESFPNTLGEAAACGVPCVTTDVGDAAAIVDGVGWVVPSGDAEALVGAWDAVLALSRQQRQRIGQASRARIVAQYEIGSVARRYADLYESLANGRQP